MEYLLLPAAAVLVLALAHLAARRAASRLRSLPDAYSTESLGPEPDGETVFIDRPDGTRIRAVVAGHGPTVVLAHGFGSALRQWRVVFDRLARGGNRVIAFDQRGHAGSTAGSDGIGSRQMAGDYAAILEHFDARDAVLVGHSMGGFLSLVFLLTSPEEAVRRLRGVVLFSATAGDVLKGSLQNRVQVALVRWGLIRRVLRSPTYGWLLGASQCGDRPSPTGIRSFLEVAGAQDPKPLLPILDALTGEDYYPRLGEIRTPCVVICGTKDRTTPPWHSRRLAAEIPGARAVWVEGKGHLLNWEAPEALIEAVRSLRAD